MKFRTGLLVACIVVVPLIAMFSHRVPPGTRAALGQWLRDLVGHRSPAAAAPVQAAGPVTPPPVVEMVPAAALPASAVSGPSHVVPVAAVLAEPDSVSRLRELGAVAIDCRPLNGHGGHMASCRVPVDAAGQLERVFQATGVDASTAADNLLRDVTAWRRGTERLRTGTMRF